MGLITPRPGVEPGCPFGRQFSSLFETAAIPLGDLGL